MYEGENVSRRVIERSDIFEVWRHVKYSLTRPSCEGGSNGRRGVTVY